MPLILMEGPDGGGKTHTAQTLFSQYQYQHNGPPAPGNTPADTFWWQLEGLLPRAAHHTSWVVDRNWPSEQIYHRFAGRPHVFNPLVQRMFERYALSQQGIVVMCLPPYDVAHETWKRRVEEGKELLTEDEQFATMYEFYRSWHESTCLPVHHFDFTKYDANDELEDFIRSEHTCEILQNPAPGIIWGNPHADILVVGEQYNVKARPNGPHIPFVGTGRNGYWLSQQLELLGIPESELAWVNALQPDGSVTSAQLAQRDWAIVIALGKVAVEWCLNSRVRRWLTVPHPAFWTRFHSKEIWPLHEHKHLLREIANV